MKNEIWVSYNYGGRALVFSKDLNLPFPPFFGLGIIINDEKEHTIFLENNDYCTTIISYNLEKEQVEINVRNVWRRPVSDETIDETIDMFSDWQRHDNEDVNLLKELMGKDGNGKLM